MPKKYPPLTDSEVTAILVALGFLYSHTKGGHHFYKKTHSGKEHTVTVDPNASPFDDFLLKSMISQSGYARDDFYAATKRTAKKIGVRPMERAEE